MTADKLIENPLIKPLSQALKRNERSIEGILKMYGSQSFGFIIALLAFVILVPTGIIPGVALACGVMIVFVIVQMLLGFNDIYVPRWLGSKQVSEKALESIIDTYHSQKKLFDFLAGRRHFDWMFHIPARYVSDILLLVVALSTIPITVLPFLETIPGFILMVFGFAIAQRNGYMMLFAWCTSVVYISFGIFGFEYLLGIFVSG